MNAVPEINLIAGKNKNRKQQHTEQFQKFHKYSCSNKQAIRIIKYAIYIIQYILYNM